MSLASHIIELSSTAPPGPRYPGTPHFLAQQADVNTGGQLGAGVHDCAEADPGVVADARALQHNYARREIAVAADHAPGEDAVRSDQGAASNRDAKGRPVGSAD